MSTDASKFIIADASARLILAADIDAQDVPSLRDEVAAGLQPPVERFVIDLSECRFLDPVAVDLIGATMGMADAQGIRMTMEGLTPNVRVILGIAGLLDFSADPGTS